MLSKIIKRRLFVVDVVQHSFQGFDQIFFRVALRGSFRLGVGHTFDAKFAFDDLGTRIVREDNVGHHFRVDGIDLQFPLAPHIDLEKVAFDRCFRKFPRAPQVLDLWSFICNDNEPSHDQWAGLRLAMSHSGRPISRLSSLNSATSAAVNSRPPLASDCLRALASS